MRWANSPLARRRTFFQTVKRLGSFFAYADPGPTGKNPRWVEIDYRPVHNEPAQPSAAIAKALISDERRGRADARRGRGHRWLRRRVAV